MDSRHTAAIHRRRVRPCRDHERRWRDHCVDINLEDAWLERLNQLRCFHLISICEGHPGRSRPHVNLKLKQEHHPLIANVFDETRTAVGSIIEADSEHYAMSVEIDRRWRVRTPLRRTPPRDDLVLRASRCSQPAAWNEATQSWFDRCVQGVEFVDWFVSAELDISRDSGDVWYFAYGSNLFIDQKEERTGGIRCAVRCRLEKHRLAFNKRGTAGVVANIMPDETRCVWGVAYLCSRDAMEKMDQWEGGYECRELSIITESGKHLNASTYIASDKYLDKVLRGARDHRLPAEYVAWLAGHGPE